MASTGSLRALPTLAGRRTSLAVRPIVPFATRYGSLHQPRRSLRQYSIGFVLGTGVGVGTCAAWWKFPSSLTPSAPSLHSDFDLDLALGPLLESLYEILQHPKHRELLDQMGSSSKLKLVFESNEMSFQEMTLVNDEPITSVHRVTLFRIEDTDIQPGEPNVVGLLAFGGANLIVNSEQFLSLLHVVAEQCGERSDFARQDMALIVVAGGSNAGAAIYQRLDIGESGGQSGSPDDSVIENMRE